MLQKKFVFIYLIGAFLWLSSVFAGTILSSTKYAWSDNVGYISFENVIVDDSTLSGYAWSQNAGWIKFNPAQGGVTQDGNGDLSGSAWWEQLGWIDFDNVTIDTDTGQFSGTASGPLVGTITFDCPNYCDVRTDWRPGGTPTCTSWTYSSWSTCSGGLQTRTILSSSPLSCTGGSPVLTQSCTSGGGGGWWGGRWWFPIIPKHVETIDTPLTILPIQSGTFTENTDTGIVILDIPANNVQKKTTFFITPEPLVTENVHLILESTDLVNNTFYEIFAKDENDNFVHSFSSPITLTLPIPKNLQNIQNLGVYWLNETNWQWVLIPDALFSEDTVVFQVNHLTRFGIFQKKIEPEELPEKLASTLPLPGKKPRIPQIPKTTSPKIIEPEKTEETVMQKIENLIDPVIPKFLKSKEKKIFHNNTSTPVSRDEWREMWILILCVLFLFLIFRRKRKEKEKKR